MIEGYARGMLKVVHQKTKHPDRVVNPTTTLLELQELAEGGGVSLTIKRTELNEGYANILVNNKPFRIDLSSSLAEMAEQIGIVTTEVPVSETGVEIVEFSPAALALINELGVEVDLALITGTGADGKILKKDVEQYLEEIEE